MNIFGFEIKSKEEREQEEREYLHRIFPGGTAQKAAVEQQLKEKLPKEDKKRLGAYTQETILNMLKKHREDF